MLSGVTREMKVYSEETFGPIAPVIRASGVDEAVEIANNSEYGLSAAIIGRGSSTSAYRPNTEVRTRVSSQTQGSNETPSSASTQATLGSSSMFPTNRFRYGKSPSRFGNPRAAQLEKVNR